MAPSMTELSIYERMKARGINMSWYERGKRGRTDNAIPLDDQECSSGSIYLLKENGSLWTVTANGKAYQQVRPPSKKLPKTVYVWVCCKTQWDDAPISKKPGVESIFHPDKKATKREGEGDGKHAKD